MSSAPEIRGHPDAPLLDDAGNLISMVTVCAHCGAARTIIFLRKDRWFCFRCLTEGAAPPNLYPIA